MATQEITRLGAIVFGATGFTGQFAVLELWKLAKEKGNFTWGISGRNKTKLEDLLKEISKKTSEDLTKIPIIIADIKDSESLNAMAKRCQIVINCAGPYRFYGEAVVKACVASGTHHVDVSGEPQYMERMQLEYHKAAEEKGVYIVSACGFDSIPADLGTAFFVKTFGGDVNSVETYLQSSLKKGINAEGAVLHYGTWESAVYGLAHANELKPLRTKLFPNRLPPMTPKLKPRPLVHKSKLVKGWCVPFPGSDRSVVMRSQRYFLESKKQRPVQMLAYASFDSIFTVLALAFVGLIFAMFSRFSFGRMLLLKFPRLFSCGFASHEGPTEEVMKNTEFSITFYCEGWKEKLAEPTDIHTSPPNKKLIGKVSGMDPGYGLTATALVMSAITVLEESSKMPGKGGVFPPGAAFSETSLIEQLNKRGMTFEVLSVEDVKESQVPWYDEPPMDVYWDNSPAENYSCGYYNQTTKKIITSAYEGIPENLLLNFIGWLILLMLFAVLRKRAWNYGRIALVQKTEEKWTQLFYGTTEEGSGVSEADVLNTPDSNIHIDKGFCSWLTAVFKTKDDKILQKCGPDAVQYLSFQRHVIFYISIVMIISLTVVLPINFQGTLEGDEKTFGHTTLHNLDPNSSFLWIHVTLAILYLPLGIIIMRRFSMTMKFEDKNTSVSRTLMITNMPPNECDSADLHRHFREAYPEMEIQDVQFAYNITKVSILDKKRENVYQAKLYCENYLKENGVRLDIKPYVFGNICGCCDMCGCPKVDAIEYYTEEESRLRNQVDTERVEALKRPLGIAFVTLASIEAAQRVYTDHLPSCKCSTNPPSSSISRRLQSYDWQVKFAPSPKDIFWENLALASNYWYLKALFINLFLFVILFFLTTPAIVVNFLDSVMVANELQKMSPVLSEFLPTLLLWTVAALLPVLVSYSDQWLSHWTRSEQNHSIMIKTFSFLLFMVLILPSLGLTSAQAFLDWTIHARNQTYRWECLFLPDKGAFFVNYVTTSALIGTGLELIRFPELFMYVCRLALARSPAETNNVRKAILWEFPFGVQYAWMLLIFAMTTMFSLSCPLITPFGLLYMVLKHLVDRYNIYFAYSPSKISSQIHATAINAVIVSITLLQLSFTALAILRRGFNDIAIYSMVGLGITCIFLFSQIVLQSCKGFSPITYQPRRSSSSTAILTSAHRDVSYHQFVPSVLQSSNNQPRPADMVSVQSPEEGLSVIQRTYGTHNQSEAIVPVSSDDRALLYQDYDGSNTEV